MPSGCDAGAEVAQRARQVAVAAERQHERHAIAQRRAAGGDDRQAAGEADAHDPDAPVGAIGFGWLASHSAASSIMSVVRGVIR